ncbi:MAG: dihydropteroate synthase [Methyloceanibacter sp.]|jgi:dihydropteroate synthase-like protein|nr:dihydropteroate synthase [Methyloceanibacter sp.]
MAESILFLTGHLARPRLEAVLQGMNASFGWKVLDIGVKVAALMTEEIIARRLPKPVEADKILLPGRCRADLERLSERFGVPFLRGPDELKDIPIFFGRARKASDMTKYDIQIFAEIVDASALAVDAIVKRAEGYVQRGANVIDLGCLPDTPFPHLEEAIRTLKEMGYKVSVDSADSGELLRGGKAGADYLLSLNEETLHIADQVASVPVLIPKDHGDLASLYRAMDALDAKGRPYLADPVLDPINFGFTASLERYAQVRRERPKAELLMGTGNLTELTDADTTGITAVLLGIASELHIKNVLVVQVSPHTRRTVEEHDIARRIMYASRAEHELPKDYADGLLALHARRPFPQTPEEITQAAREVRDKNFRIEIAEDGIHVYNRDGHHVAQEAFALFAKLGVEADGAHAFYLGAELARAEIAWRLAKRYAQDEPLDWGVAADAPADDKTRLKEAGHTLIAKRKREAS